LRVAVLATGGKDSVLSLHQAMKEDHEIAYLATMIPLKEDSWMFHYPNIHMVDFLSRAVEIPIVKSETSGTKEKELEDLKQLVAKLDVDGLVSGAIASEYQKTRIDKICAQLRLKSITPLWHMDPLEVLKKILDLQFEAIITGTYALGFDGRWLGRRINTETVNALLELNKQYGVSLVGEGGEYETLVLNAPFFKKKIKIIKAEKIWNNQSGTFLITEAQLENK
jgi:ABC transporter with metal-binding/Fe-S-binding domain ATP-binding protein